jgi:hypothetical protein
MVRVLRITIACVIAAGLIYCWVSVPKVVPYFLLALLAIAIMAFGNRVLFILIVKPLAYLIEELANLKSH